MNRYRVVVSDQVFPSVEIERELLAEIDASLEVARGERPEVLEQLRHADAILNTYFRFDREAIAALERCRIIARYGIGVDNVDLEAAREKGIVVTNVPDYSVEEVAAHALALSLTLLRRVKQADDLVRQGSWSVDNLRPIRRLSRLRAGLYGYGRIGRRLADALLALGMEVVVHDPYVQPGPGVPELVDLDTLLHTSDLVSIHAPLTPETRGIIGASALGRMKEGAVLVNTSRGPLVVLDDLLEALRSGAIGGVGLDVFEEEPLDPRRIEGIPNLIATPHMAYYSEDALEESQRKAATQVVKVLTGREPDYAVNRG